MRVRIIAGKVAGTESVVLQVLGCVRASSRAGRPVQRVSAVGRRRRDVLVDWQQGSRC